jgi:hypothetical protein
LRRRRISGLDHPKLNKGTTVRPARREACAEDLGDCPFFRSIRGTTQGGFARRGRVFPLIVADIPIHIEAAERALERINHSIMVLVEFLKVIVQDLTSLGVRSSTCSTVSAGVIALRLLEYSMIREVWLGLDDRQ